MQNAIKFELLNLLRSKENCNGYKIYSFNELSLELPKYLGADEKAVKECVDALNADGYISVKYRDDLQVCLILTDKKVQNNITEADDKKGKRKDFSNAFLGGIAGGLIGALLTFACTLLGGGKC